MEHHNDLRRHTKMWDVYQMNVVEFLRKTCELSHQFSEEEIHSTCGILDVNSYEIRLFDNDNGALGVFPLASMLSHHCVSNTHHVIDAKSIQLFFKFALIIKFKFSFIIRYEMTVRATVPINKGEQIFASYTMPLEGNLMKP